ncbi:hypothetical protein [Pedobacter mucosus]|uniref:hypothetical protein n=1 Tax=Pedobacter mucosus TaxID=2895286 RepID=UPI001EE454E1|nr:hypothetical protein [Pedobacter mucosus]UKT65965.1 hypothetical protein LOK61_09265 [Pedobacter mucosus]
MSRKTKKTVNVLIDLLGFGIVNLPIHYALEFNKLQPATLLVNCRIGLNDSSGQPWIHSTLFGLVFSRLEHGQGYVVTFTGLGVNKNIYYTAMLDVVSDYFFLKDETLAGYLNPKV